MNKFFFFQKMIFRFNFFFFISLHFIKSNHYQMIKMFFLFCFFVIDFDLKNIYLTCFKTKTNNLNLICQYQFDYVICQRCIFQNNRCNFVKYSFSEKNKNQFKKKFSLFSRFLNEFSKNDLSIATVQTLWTNKKNCFVLKKYYRRIFALTFSIRFLKTCDNIFRFDNK